ncbi:hypothetical protein [Lysobacter xanthus]
MHRLRPALLAVVLLLGSADAVAEGPNDPTNDPMLMTAGFLQSHPDIQYRLLGLQAYDRKKFDDAFRFFRRASFYADKPSQGMVAEMYWKGEGVARDPALAYAWMDLAAERGYRGFLGLRETYWAALTPAERERAVREGEAVYARFGDDAAKPRYEFQLRVGRREMTGSRTGFNHGVTIEIPGPEGGQSIPGSRFYDDRYWNAKKYWAWQDKVWMHPRIGRVTTGGLEDVRRTPASRVPQVAPEVDAQVPDAPAPPH